MKTSSLYTRRGDAGTTTLVDGRHVPKSAPVIESVGAIDELSAHIGLLAARMADGSAVPLQNIQRRLFAIGARLAGVSSPHFFPDDEAVRRLEALIDSSEAGTFDGFVLPGGHPLAAQAHVCRAVCRRAERCVVAAECPEAVPYLNRLADYFFALASEINQNNGFPEIKL